jgi:hypothetical protein
MSRKATAQAKLSISNPGDAFEQEADRVAEQVIRMPEPAFALQRKSERGNRSGLESERSPHEELLVRRRVTPADSSSSAATAPPIVHDTLRSTGQALDTSTRAFFEARFQQDFSDVRVHTDAQAAASARAVDALAYTVGPQIVFGAGQYAPQTTEGSRLLAHELTHVVQSTRNLRSDSTRATEIARPDCAVQRYPNRIAGTGVSTSYSISQPMVFRAVPRAAARLTANAIFGVAPGSGLTLNEFKQYTQEEADWFVEPTLSVGSNRIDLWDLLLRAQESHIISGVGDVKVSELRGVSSSDWIPLRAFCRGTHDSGHTVRIFLPFPPLPDRIALGRTLIGMEAVIPGPVLEVTVSQSQLLQVQTLGLLPLLTTYWTNFQPHIEQTFRPAPGVTGVEFARVITFLQSLGGPAGLTALDALRGATPDTRWVRNLHRFPLPMLQRLVANFADTSGTKRLILVLFSGHDAPASFQVAAGLFSNLVLASPDNLVLMIEGATSLAAITNRIPDIAAKWGKHGGGTRRISEVLIAGHGSTQSVELAGTSAPTVLDGNVTYTSESMDISNPASRATAQALLDALFTHMPPASARILYAGCLVGATHVAAGTPAAAIPAAVTAQQNLADFTRSRATATGRTPGRVAAARASVPIGDLTGLFNPATGSLRPIFPSDPNAFGSAQSYASSGREPEGVFRAAVQVAATNTVTAETLLRARFAMPAVPTDWYDVVTRMLVALALPAVPGGGVNIERINEIANVAETLLLSFWPQFGITAASYRNNLNPLPFAALVYTGMAATTPYTNPSAQHTERLRLIVDQGWLALVGAARVAPFLAGIQATGMSASAFAPFLDLPSISGHAATLLPLVGVPTVAQIRLALAWYSLDNANANVRAFLTTQVQHPPNAPVVFSPAVNAELTGAGLNADDVLGDLGFLRVAMAPGGGGGGAPQPFANLALPGSPTRTLLTTGRPYLATVTAIPHTIARLDRNAPNSGIALFNTGSRVHVTGIIAGWAAVDVSGRLAFINMSDLSPPPP